MPNADWNPEKTLREFRVRKVDRYIVTDWSDYRGCVESTVREVCGPSTLEQANAIAEALGKLHPGALVNPMEPPLDSYMLASIDQAATTPSGDQVKVMVERFLSWKLPPDFRPDGGITAKRPNYAPEVKWEPSGTNLLDYTQATAMVRHMLGQDA